MGISLITVLAVSIFIMPVQSAEDPYAPTDGQTPPAAEEEGSLVPWVVGGLLVGGGAAAAIVANSDSGGDDDDDSGSTTPTATPTPDASPTPGGSATPTPSPTPTPGGGAAGCEEGDVSGTWQSPEEIDGDQATTYTFVLSAGGSATYETSTVTTPSDGSPPSGIAGSHPGTWSLSESDCVITLDPGSGSEFDGSGQVMGNAVVINGRTFMKQ